MHYMCITFCNGLVKGEGTYSGIEIVVGLLYICRYFIDPDRRVEKSRANRSRVADLIET